MYKIVSITALTTANVFISSDKIIQISNDRTKMHRGENDYEHKNKFYLSSCIENADRSLNSYLSAYDGLSNTYITSALSNVYIESGNLITKETVDKILSSDAFLTKDGCKAFEAECIAYINELKNKAVSIIMTKLNESFIAQNSVKRPVYGQIKDGQDYQYMQKIQLEETFADYSNPAGPGYNFDFKKGAFTLAKLIFWKSPNTGDTGIVTKRDLYKSPTYYNSAAQSYYMNETFETAADLISELQGNNSTGSNCCIFNAADQSNYDLKIVVPETSFDYQKKQSIPMAKLISFVLKNQIYHVITNVCNHYAAMMISVPTLKKN